MLGLAKRADRRSIICSIPTRYMFTRQMQISGKFPNDCTARCLTICNHPSSSSFWQLEISVANFSLERFRNVFRGSFRFYLSRLFLCLESRDCIYVAGRLAARLCGNYTRYWFGVGSTQIRCPFRKMIHPSANNVLWKFNWVMSKWYRTVHFILLRYRCHMALSDRNYWYL